MMTSHHHIIIPPHYSFNFPKIQPKQSSNTPRQRYEELPCPLRHGDLEFGLVALCCTIASLPPSPIRTAICHYLTLHSSSLLLLSTIPNPTILSSSSSSSSSSLSSLASSTHTPNSKIAPRSIHSCTPTHCTNCTRITTALPLHTHCIAFLVSTITMSSANADKTALAEKAFLNPSYLPTSHPTNGSSQLPLRDNRPRRAMMSRIKHALFVLFALVLLASALVGASTSGSRALSPEAQQFRELLDTLDAATLHEILHEHFKDKYQHGVYQQDKSALEALHKQNSEVARTLVRLARRQDVSNGSTVVTTTAVTETTIQVTVTSTSTPSSPPVVPTPTPTPSTTSSTPVSTPPTSSTVSNPPVSTTTTSSPSSTTPVESSSSSTPSTSVHSTLSSSTTSASPTTSSATSSASSGTTRAPTKEDVTTSYVYTTTLANGAAVLTTQYTVVPADQVAQPTGSGGSSTNTAKASLQTGLANSQYQQGGWTMGLGFLSVVVAYNL